MNKYGKSGGDIEVGMGVVLVMGMVQVMEVVLFMVLVLVLGEVMVVVIVITFSVRLHLCARHRGRNFPYLYFSTALKDGHYFPCFIVVGTQLVRSHKASS